MRVVTSPDPDIWSRYVSEHPHGNIFQTPEIAEVFRLTKNYKPITLAVVDNGDILALLQAVVISELGGKLGTLTSRSIVYGGPIVVNDKSGIEALKLLMSSYDRKILGNAIYTELRNMWDTSNISNVMNNIGYIYKEHLNFLLNLSKSREDLWNNLTKKRRNNIRRAKKKGVKVKEINDIDSIPIFYNILYDTYKNAKLPLADISLFYSVFNILYPRDMAKFFVAEYEDRYIGGILVLIYRGYVYWWYGGMLREFSRFCPTDLLLWHAIEWSSKKGYRIFDFGGAGSPNKEYGVRKFKEQFGGKKVNFGRYRKIHSPLKWRFVSLLFRFYRRLKW